MDALPEEFSPVEYLSDKSNDYLRYGKEITCSVNYVNCF